MKKITVVYFSGYGHTRRMAHSVANGADASLVEVDDNGNLPSEGWETLLQSDAIVFGAPTYMGSVPWQFKKFIDASSEFWSTQAWKDKIAAGFTNSASINGDKHATLHYLFTLAMQHGMIWVGHPLLPNNHKGGERNQLNYLGSFSGAMAQTPSDASPNEMWPADLETARLFGERIAGVTARFAR